MSTRGTYNINNRMLLYVHHDNYPAGAAAKFIEVIRKSKGDFDLLSIIRGMEAAMETKNLFNGRAEYHYIIQGDDVRCYAVDMDEDVLHYHSGGNVAEWCNEMVKPLLEADDKPEDWAIVSTPANQYYPARYYVKSAYIEDANKIFDRACELADIGHSGNATSDFSDYFRRMNEAKIEADKDKISLYMTKYVPMFVKAYNHDNDAIFAGYVDKGKTE